MNQPPLPSSQSGPNSPKPTTRRDFLKTTTAAAGGVLAARLNLSPTAQAATAGGDTLRVGLVGCGGRGTGAAGQALHADKNVVLTAMGDAFENQLKGSLSTLKQEVPERVQVSPEKQFVGLDAFQKVIDSGVDVVVLCSPPGFRPQHLRAAVAAGKHIFCEKPVATDAPGIRTVLECVEEAKKKKLAWMAGFCWRYDFGRREFFKRVHDGQLGGLRAIYGTYYTGPVKPMPPSSDRAAGMTDLEWQLRNWYNFTWTCGDSLVEQAVHSVDKMAWAMKDEMPVKAVAVGGRQIPAQGGNIFDHFEVNYEYKSGTRGFLGCRQQSGCYSENNDYLLGEKGIGTIRSGKLDLKSGTSSWRYSGPANDMYQTEHNELFASIRKGQPIQDGLWMTNSCLMAIMGRMAAYTGQEITWEMALNSQEKLVPDPLTWDMKIEVPPLARPGITKFV
jgi:myo-inositol 2-dehydrogenase / D-chiro-inositol 1-dehydrogenase